MFLRNIFLVSSQFYETKSSKAKMVFLIHCARKFCLAFLFFPTFILKAFSEVQYVSAEKYFIRIRIFVKD